MENSENIEHVQMRKIQKLERKKLITYNELKGNINCKETNDVIDFSIEKNESAINLIHFYKSLKCNYFMQIFE